ncbi:ABC transporter substrate-binding protein [Priestia endophytica]|uniref:ABC transporter substrate-binding protein n=1 Tax=Priestia endophytica TaxID=135735 RepID=UPI00203AFD12|nr:ABC transporter substrate-binding protein [Priestia endophytica]MCM3540954.1 ABC transporter substrate-binding protein [Priestia endophytica]
MKKELLNICLIGTLSLSLYGCQQKVKKETQEVKQDEITLSIRNPKVEIAAPFEEMVQAYEKEQPHINIEVHTVGGAIDDLSDLKAELAAGEGPDIFTNQGGKSAELWHDYLEDLSGEPWVPQALPETLASIKSGEKVYGMPMNIEGYGFIYNKDLFAKAGIQQLPTTLNELETTAERLKKAGITPFSLGYYEKWQLGDHLMNIAFLQQKDPNAYITQLNNGSKTITNNQKFKDLTHLLDVTLKYGNSDPLETDYTMEMDIFSKGEAAIALQGNWIQPLIDQRSPNLNVGIMPIPLSNNHGEQSLIVNTPNYWVINKQTTPKKKQAAKKFLDWMVSSKEGQEFMTKQFRFIPAFKNIPSNQSGPLATETLRYYKEDRTVSASTLYFPVGVREQFGAATQQYIAKRLTQTQLLKRYQYAWESAQGE